VALGWLQINPTSQVLEDSWTFQMIMERMRWTHQWLLLLENGEKEALQVAKVEVPHQNQPNITSISSLLFIQLSLFVFCFFVICYAAAKSCCWITCLIMCIVLSDPCPLSLTMQVVWNTSCMGFCLCSVFPLPNHLHCSKTLY